MLVSARGHGFENLTSISLSELENAALILPGRPHGLRLRIDEIAANLCIRLNVILEADGLNAVLDLVHRGIGYSVLTPPALYGYKWDGDMVVTRIEPSVTSTVVAVTSRQRPMSNAVRTLLKIVREEARKVRHGEVTNMTMARKAGSVEILKPKIVRRSLAS